MKTGQMYIGGEWVEVDVADRGSVELVAEFAVPLPVPAEPLEPAPLPEESRSSLAQPTSGTRLNAPSQRRNWRRSAISRKSRINPIDRGKHLSS